MHLCVIAAVSFAAMLFMSCIFDSEPVIPGYPGEIDAEISYSSIGSPYLCKCMYDYELAIVAAGTGIAVVDIVNGENISVFDMELEIDDIADSDMNGFGYILVDSLLYPLDLSALSFTDPIDLCIGCSFVSVSTENNTAWVSMNNDSIGAVDLVSGDVTAVPDFVVRNCQGLASADNSILYIAEGDNSIIAGYNTDTWSEVGRVSVPGEVYDLFPGPAGYICAIVEGSNELWFIKSDTSVLYKMITFPVIPTAAASMPDGSFAYAACPGVGTLVVAESGQPEMRSMDFGIPSSIDISSDGNRAVICSPDNEAVYILVR